RAQQKNLRGRGGRLMDVFGSFTLLLAFVCAVYAFVGGIAAILTRHPLLVKSARQAGIATCALIFIGTFSLEYLLFSDNFSVAYVVSHSNRDLSAFYKIAALWSGQEGSLLFWSFLLAVYVISVLIAYRHKNGAWMATASIRCCSTRRWSSIRRICIPAIRASRFRSPLRWLRCWHGIPAKSGFTLRANGP